jgi:hypothetical protein
MSSFTNEQRHLRQPISDREQLQVSRILLAKLIGHAQTVLAGWEREWLFLNLVPDGFVQSARIARCWTERIDDQNVNTRPQKLNRLDYKTVECRSTVLVTR